MKAIEKEALEILEKAFTAQPLSSYTFDIQDYFADEGDRLEEETPKMNNYLQDIIPEFTNEYDNRQ